MKESILFFSAFIFISFSAIAQDNFLVGKWKFEKIPDHVELDEQQVKMAPKMFGDMTVSFDDQNFSFTMMGGTVTGTWEKLDDGTYKLSSEGGMMQGAVITKVSDNQINLKPVQGEMQLIKMDDALPAIDESETLSINGAKVKKELLYGKWYYNGQINDVLDDRLNDMVPEHKKGEPINYSFKEDGKLISRGIKGKMETGSWSIADDNQTLNIKSKELSGSLKIVRLDDSQLYYYYPAMDATIKFKRSAKPVEHNYLSGEWVFDKIPDDKGLSEQEQEMASDLFGKTTLSFKKSKFNLTKPESSFKGTWKSVTENLIELRSSDGSISEIGINKINNNQVVFVFGGTVELVMKKSGK